MEARDVTPGATQFEDWSFVNSSHITGINMEVRVFPSGMGCVFVCGLQTLHTTGSPLLSERP